MSDCSENKNPLQHNGTSQAQRLLPGMDKNKYALADEKKYADWIVFAGEFARYIKYYSTENVFTKHWQDFFSKDISAQLGVLAIQDIERYRTEIKERLDFIRDDDNNSSPNAVKLNLNELFSAILTLCKALDETMTSLSAETRLKATILNLIKTKLAPGLKTFIAYHNAAKDHGYLNHSFLCNWKILNKALIDANDIIYTEGLGNSWLYDTDKVNWNDYVGTIPPTGDDSIFNDPLNGVSGFASDYKSMAHAANHNLFTGIFDTFLSTYTRIIRDAESELLKTLDNYDAHPAHYALFLSFLKLFRFAQDHINTVTQRHLDFYYKEVLKLQPRPAEANQVHVLGELAKQVDEYLLAAGTALKAGKDSLGNEVAYTLNTDSVFNKAKVAQLKTFYKGYSDDSVFDPVTKAEKQNNAGRVFASPVANSDDGLGAELTSVSKEWHPYVHKVYADATLQSIAMPKAQLGFALASHYLYLTEGERKVSIRLVTAPVKVFNKNNILCWLTTEKGWYQVIAGQLATAEGQFTDGVDYTEISFTIPGSDPAIVNYNAAVHGGTFNCELPILKIYLLNEDNIAYEYDLLKDITISKVAIKVDVGMDSGYTQKGLKNLLLSNDFGPLDASKPFMPFGGQPKKDAGFIIGHKEIFSKKNTKVKLNIEWAEISAFDQADISYISSGDYPGAKVSLLASGIWNTQDGATNIFDGNTEQVAIDTSGIIIPDETITPYEDDYQTLGPSTTNGFIRLSLNDGFGYQDYILAMSVYLIGQSKDPAVGSKPDEPYLPKIKSIYASYSASAEFELTVDSDFEGREIRFFHLYPFGEGEQHSTLQTASEVHLLPQFNHVVEGTAQPHTGEFYTGIENLEPGQAVNVLFQVMEGTSDPTLAKPQEHVHWSYLAQNQWIAFEADEYSDNTLDLVQSGIISFAIPNEATTDNTILPAGFIWIRASVIEAAEAVCKLLAVSAQAAVATFSDNNNAEDFLNSPLAAGTIAKLKTPDAAIKKLSQPYPSFGGKPKETNDHFYIRVSERLRHKARAITIWDYERLVLEAFPEIYKVKCLNHTQIEEGVYNEVRPGYVSIITIPALQNRNDADPLKPYTQQSTLTNIENFLKEKTSCFVKLRACQPQFEEIRLEFSLKLHDTYKDFTYYSNLLKEEITQFLSPWAYGNASSLDFGGKVNKSTLINFIEERYYVNYITDVFMYVTVDDETNESADMDEIPASTARSILVSAPASKHIISPIPEDTVDQTGTCFDT